MIINIYFIQFCVSKCTKMLHKIFSYMQITNEAGRMKKSHLACVLCKSPTIQYSIIPLVKSRICYFQRNILFSAI